MFTHQETREMPYSADQMFDLVADVKQYPAFLPWCLASRVTTLDAETLMADLVVGYQFYKETFTSKVILTPKTGVEVQYQQGPFQVLNNRWTFTAIDEKCCTIDFLVDFQFKNPLFERVLTDFFEKATKRMVQAFEERAHLLYNRKVA